MENRIEYSIDVNIEILYFSEIQVLMTTFTELHCSVIFIDLIYHKNYRDYKIAIVLRTEPIPTYFNYLLIK